MGFAPFVAALISGVVMVILAEPLRHHPPSLNEANDRSRIFERKYSLGLRLFTGVLVALGGILNMGVFLKIEGEFLTVISGINAQISRHRYDDHLLLEMLYSVVGGMVSS